MPGKTSIGDYPPYRNRAVASDRPDHGPLADGTRRVELARTLASDGTPYLCVLIRKPLADSEIELLETFLDMLAPDHGYVYQPREASNAR